VQDLPEHGDARSEDPEDDDGDPADLDGASGQFERREEPIVHEQSLRFMD
jgi:hypothetical protein